MARDTTTIGVSRVTQARLRKLSGWLATKTGKQTTLDGALTYALDVMEKLILVETVIESHPEADISRDMLDGLAAQENQGE